MPVALITGGSLGLGRALVLELAGRGWTVITDGRDARRLDGVSGRGVVTVAGDVTDARHRDQLAAAVRAAGRLDLLVHNAGTLGPAPLPRIDAVTPEDIQATMRPNFGAPLVLTAQLLPDLVSSGGVLVGISSDAAVNHYPGWGLYGATKAALDHLVLQYAAENPVIAGYAIDPGDMRTDMHQAAFPDEDISDRPLPEEVAPRIIALVEARPASGRYRAADVGSVALAEVSP
jgi:NAD(P)-dependent dehydrogenase (short-subunit alcohol dehydrogenase family)